jgi:hypothetical protein
MWLILVPRKEASGNRAACTALTCIDQLTGCDTVSSIYGVGKVKAVKALQKGHVPPPLGNNQIDIETIVSGAIEFIAACYGSKCSGTMSQQSHIVQAAISSTYFGSLWASRETGTSPGMHMEGCIRFRSTCTRCRGLWMAV